MAPPTKKRKLDVRRKSGPQADEIPFDSEARSDYLTGFRKRKQQRIKHAQEENAKKERAMKVESRKITQLREQRKQDLDTHVQTVNAILKRTRRAELGQDSDSEGDSDSAPSGSDRAVEDALEPANASREDEYIDEEKYTTVTIEPMKMPGDDESSAAEDEIVGGQGEPTVSSEPRQKRTWTKEKPTKSRPKPKKKKFRYESKVERKATRSKQASKNSAAAKARREATTR